MRVEKIGKATLYLGDCLEILPTLDKVDAVVTDPPYGMGFQSNYYKGANGRPNAAGHSKIANDDTEDLLIWATQIPAAHSKYIFCRWDNVWSVARPKSLVTWVKNNHSMGDLKGEHARKTECALFYKGANHAFPAERPTDVVYADRTGNKLHPTEKPVSLMEQFVKWTAGVVLDPFMGSGTTGVACMNLGREFIGIEIEEKYFDIACERIDQAQKQQRLFA